ncbi:proline-rich domain-containing protein [Microlunatus ginsengisoli]|uniref:DUF4878 domain-containing protein n=1 Tax=Microlunatus ginsengisoli TaxID=363863 RepID=A0ABP6ZQN1_9ACTN
MSDQQPPGQPSGEPPYQPPAGGWYDPIPGGQAGAPTPYPPPGYQPSHYQQGPYRPDQQGPDQPGAYQQPWSQGPRDQQPPAGWTQPPAGGGQPPPRKSSTALVLALAGGAIALVLIVIVAGIAIGRRDKPITDPVPSNPSGGLPSSGLSTAPPSATAADAVRAYFAALTSNDADAALALGVDRPDEKALLTSAVLAESNRIAPIRDVTVTDTSDPGGGTVSVSYRIGATAVRESMPVVKVGDEWRLGRTYTWLDLATATAYGRNPVVVNKVRLSRTTAGVFPGTYAFASASRYTSLSSRSVTVAGLTRTPSTTALRLQLTKVGVDQVRNAARKSVTSCMKQRKLHPAGCPLGVNPGGYRVDAKTLRWKRQGGDPIGKAKVRFDAATLEASTSFRFRVNGTIRCRSSAGSGTCTVRIDHKRTALIQLTRPDRVYWS